MSFYERAYNLYYRMRLAGYSVPVDFQVQMEELEKLEHKQFSQPRYIQPLLTPIEPKHIRRGGIPIRQRKLPSRESLESFKDSYTPPKINKLKQAKSKLSQSYIQPKVSTAQQDPLKPLDTDNLIVSASLRYRYSRDSAIELEQPKLTKIEDDTILKPLIRTKRKSWGGKSRIYTLNVQNLTSLKRTILKRYKRPKLNHYETQGQDLKELTSRLRRGLSHIKYIADVKLSDATPIASYNLAFTPYYELLVMRVFKVDVYGEMTKAQRKAFNTAWQQGQISPEVIRNGMLAKLAEYGGGDIRTSDPKAITRIVQANDLAVRRVLANIIDLVATGWEEYNQQKLDEMVSHKTTVGAMLNEHDVAEKEDADLRYMIDN